jgi:hypothetical protein
MPSGYTAGVVDGKITSLRAFALSCARGMGACIMQRDDDMREMPKKREAELYNVQALDAARERLGRFSAMSLKEANSLAAKKRKEAKADDLVSAERWKLERERYNHMLEKVKAWEGAPEGLKEFMISQLRESIRFDCSDKPYTSSTNHIKDGKTYRNWEVDRAKRDVELRQQQLEHDVQRVKEQNEWIDKLYASLPSE